MRPSCAFRHLLFAAIFTLGACATGTSPFSDDDDVTGLPDAGSPQPDALITPLPDAAATTPDAATVPTPDAATTPTPDASSSSTAVTLSHSTSMTVAEANTIACAEETTNYTSENSYYRTFDLDSFGVSGDLHITSVDIGIESAVAGLGGEQSATLNLYTLSGAAATDNLTQLDSVAITVPDQELDVMTVDVSVTVPADSTLVVELYIPDGTVDGNALFIGSNTSGETGPTYIRAPDCSVDDMTTLSSLSYPDVAWVLSVDGTY